MATNDVVGHNRRIVALNLLASFGKQFIFPLPAARQPRPLSFYETAGRNAFRLGLNSFSCTLAIGTTAYKAWMKGYAVAKASKLSFFDPKRKPNVALLPRYISNGEKRQGSRG